MQSIDHHTHLLFEARPTPWLRELFMECKEFFTIWVILADYFPPKN